MESALGERSMPWWEVRYPHSLPYGPAQGLFQGKRSTAGRRAVLASGALVASTGKHVSHADLDRSPSVGRLSFRSHQPNSCPNTHE